MQASSRIECSRGGAPWHLLRGALAVDSRSVQGQVELFVATDERSHAPLRVAEGIASASPQSVDQRAIRTIPLPTVPYK